MTLPLAVSVTSEMATTFAHGWLIEQSRFHWMGLQTIEKYLKAILLYNKIKAPKVGHSLKKALDKCHHLPFSIQLSKSSVELIEHLDRYGQSRYLEVSHHIYGP